MTDDQIGQDSADIHKIELEGKTITLVGTAHVSTKSVELVNKVINEIKPDVVAIELDNRRLEALKDPERWKKTDLFKSIKDGNAYVLLTQLILQSFQKKISADLGVRPGAEMLAAYSTANQLGISSLCIDRDIRTTLKRAWAKAGWWSVTKVLFAILVSMFEGKTVSEEEIEKLKEKDALAAALEEFSVLLPDVKTSLIDERDSYMSQKLLDAVGKNIVAVVGAGHVPGMLREIRKVNDLAELEKIPEKKKSLIKWIIPGMVIALLVIGFSVGGTDKSLEMLYTWVLDTALFGAIGAALALAHPLSILAGAVTAPLKCIHPLIAPGWFAGLSEAYLRRPRVEDLEKIGDDLVHISGWWKNRVTRILLVFALTNIGAKIGWIVGITSIVKNLL